MSEIRALAFDLDGTLADTALDLVDCAQEVCADIGWDNIPDEVFKEQISMGSVAMVAAGLNRERTDPLVQKTAVRLQKRYAARPAHLTQLYDGIAEVIHDAHRRDWPWCIVTNKPAALAHLVMDGLEPLPPGIAGVIGSGTTWHAKPSPQPLRLASQLMGIAPEHIAFVGDDRRDIDCARAVGARSIAALWGYIHRHDNPMDWGADRYAETPGQLTRAFE